MPGKSQRAGHPGKPGTGRARGPRAPRSATGPRHRECRFLTGAASRLLSSATTRQPTSAGNARAERAAGVLEGRGHWREVTDENGGNTVPVGRGVTGEQQERPDLGEFDVAEAEPEIGRAHVLNSS